MNLHVPPLEKGQSIKLDANLYNEKKTTSYRIPHDITLAPLEHPRSLSMKRV